LPADAAPVNIRVKADKARVHRAVYKFHQIARVWQIKGRKKEKEYRIYMPLLQYTSGG
jgi:hypothetical protein